MPDTSCDICWFTNKGHTEQQHALLFLIDSLDTEFQGDGVALCKPLHSYKHPNHLCFSQANYCPDKD